MDIFVDPTQSDPSCCSYIIMNRLNVVENYMFDKLSVIPDKDFFVSHCMESSMQLCKVYPEEDYKSSPKETVLSINKHLQYLSKMVSLKKEEKHEIILDEQLMLDMVESSDESNIKYRSPKSNSSSGTSISYEGLYDKYSYYKKCKAVEAVCNNIIVTMRSLKLRSSIYLVLPQFIYYNNSFAQYFKGHDIYTLDEFSELLESCSSSEIYNEDLVIDVGDKQLPPKMIHRISKLGRPSGAILMFGTAIQAHCENTRLKDYQKNDDPFRWDDIVYYEKGIWPKFNTESFPLELAINILFGFEYKKDMATILSSTCWYSNETDELLIQLYFLNIINWTGYRIALESDLIKQDLSFKIKYELMNNVVQLGIKALQLRIESSAELNEKFNQFHNALIYYLKFWSKLNKGNFNESTLQSEIYHVLSGIPNGVETEKRIKKLDQTNRCDILLKGYYSTMILETKRTIKGVTQLYKGIKQVMTKYISILNESPIQYVLVIEAFGSDDITFSSAYQLAYKKKDKVRIPKFVICNENNNGLVFVHAPVEKEEQVTVE